MLALMYPRVHKNSHVYTHPPTEETQTRGAVLPGWAQAACIQLVNCEKGQDTDMSRWLYQHLRQGGAGGRYQEWCDKLFFKKVTKKTPNPTKTWNLSTIISQSCNAVVFCESANQEWITHVKHGYEHSWFVGYLGTWNNFFFCTCWVEKTTLLNFAF